MPDSSQHRSPKIRKTCRIRSKLKIDENSLQSSIPQSMPSGLDENKNVMSPMQIQITSIRMINFTIFYSNVKHLTTLHYSIINYHQTLIFNFPPVTQIEKQICLLNNIPTFHDKPSYISHKIKTSSFSNKTIITNLTGIFSKVESPTAPMKNKK